jgi:acyl-CoA thioesterase
MRAVDGTASGGVVHPLDSSLALTPVSGTAAGDSAVFACQTSPCYRNAIGPFGGWIAALLLKAVMHMPNKQGEPLALDALFMGAIGEGDLEVRVSRLRQNRSVGFWRSEVWQRGRICAHAQVTTSVARQSMVLQDAQFPDVPDPDALSAYANPRTPVPWIDQYICKPVSGLLFSRAKSMDSRIWIRDAEPRQLDAVSLTAICDTPFPPTWIRLADQAPISTVNYSVYFRASRADLAATGTGFVLLDTQACLAQDGYVDQFTSVWSAGGRLLAQTQQMLWCADAPATRS